jgi:hypothetical protein
MNFKQSTSLFLAILVLFSSTHFALNIHSCHGMIAAVETVFETKTACHPPISDSESSCCQNHEKKNNCCSDETIEASTDDVVMESSIQIQFHFILPDAFSEYFLIEKVNTTQKLLSYYCDSNAPPLYKLYRKLILYA